MNNQIEKSNEIKSSGLRKVSNVYKWIGGIFCIYSILITIGAIIHNESESIAIGIAILFGSLFLLFAGLVGNAIDDIRNYNKK